MIDLDDLEIVSQFNAEIRGFYNYYSIANNSPAINSFYHIMSYSMYKTFARKYKSSVKKILFQYKKDGTFTVRVKRSTNHSITTVSNAKKSQGLPHATLSRGQLQ